MLHSLKKMFKSNYLFTFGVIICLFWIIMAAIIAPVVAPYDPVVQDLTLRLKAPSAGAYGLVQITLAVTFSAV